MRQSVSGRDIKWLMRGMQKLSTLIIIPGGSSFSRNFDIAVSQKEHPEVFAGIKSEQEGIKMVKRGIRFLIRNHTPWMMVPFVLDSAAKYLGYLLGKNYKKLPLAIVKKCSMNPRYWQEKESV